MVLDRLFMGEPINSNCAQSPGVRERSLQTNSHLTYLLLISRMSRSTSPRTEAFLVSSFSTFRIEYSMVV